MRITVEHNGSKIIVDESDNVNDRQATMKHEDQNKWIQDTIRVMAEQVVKLLINQPKQ